MLSKSSEKRLRNTVEFLLRFSLFALPVHMIFWSTIDFSYIQGILAAHINVLMNLLGIQSSVSGILISFSTVDGIMNVVIVRECIGWVALLTFIGLIIATPKVKLRKRVFGIIIGMPVIYLMNLVRLLTTFIASSLFGFSAFDIVHTYLWRFSLVILVFLLWVIWIRQIR